MRGLLDFFKYNNLVPITLGVVFLGAGAAAAATPEVRDAAAAAVLSQEQTVLSIDNTYIANKDLAAYAPRAQILGVTEDEDNYYVSYVIATIDLQNYVWKDTQKSEVMKVSKPDLGPYRDLGVYVTQQLKQILDRELAYLRQVQEKERKQVSQAVVATTYGGLVGQFLDTNMETLPGYTPVVIPPVEVAGQPSSGGGSDGSSSTGSGPTGATVSGGSSQIGIQVLGNNPARVPLRASYIDLGAVLLDPYNTNVGLHIFMNGVETGSPNIDTSTTTAYTIEYRATDKQGSTIVARRIVLIGEAVDPGGEVRAVGTLLPAPAAPEPAPAPEPVPTPEPTPVPAPEPTPEPVATSTPLEAPPITGQAPEPTPEPTPEPAPEPVVEQTATSTDTATTTP